MVATGAALAALLGQLSRLVKGLDDAEIEQVLAGDSKLVLLPKGAKIELPLDLYELAATVRKIDAEEEVVEVLGRDRRLTLPVLKKLATELNVSVPATAKSKQAVQLYIAQSVADHRRRTYGGV